MRTPNTRHEDKDLSPFRLHHHYIYIAFWTILASSIIYAIGGVSYIDALLLASGAATQTGLNPIDLNRLHVLQQLILWIFAMVTNVIFVNSLLVCTRLYWFRKRLRRAVNEAKLLSLMRKKKAEETELGQEDSYHVVSDVLQEYESLTQPLLGRDGENGQKQFSTRYHVMKQIAPVSTGLHVTFHEVEHEARHHPQSFTSTGPYQVVSERPYLLARPRNDAGPSVSYLPSLMWQPSIASYSDWDERQKDQLGGIEYRALKTLLMILMCYFILFHILGILLLTLWIWLTPEFGQSVTVDGVNPFWWGIFTAGSAFNDLGYTLTSDSMASFKNAAFPLILMSFLILIGNTGFPCMLRLIIWLLSKLAPYGSALNEELQFLLDHPRRCFTLLFPSGESWRLLGVLILLNGFDFTVFCTLSDRSEYQTDSRSPSTFTRLINGLFQVASTRTAGFSVTPLADIHPAIQVSFLVMMYVSAFPTAIAMRETNVYEERSLGVYEQDSDSEAESRNGQHIGLAVHIQRQLGFDLWYVMLGLFLVAIAEGGRLRKAADDPAFSLFSVLFEIVSAYGTVGLSLGYPETETSLCAQFNWVSKLVIVAMQLRGRHRGLPHALDHAILLPCESHQDGQNGRSDWLGTWLKRRSSNLSNPPTLSQGEERDDEEEYLLQA
ncbi:low-affinity potassium transport protein [Aspergillus udagawae]|uniref:Low-affinity potassium transport protein n=1 Tax=Aspergillus udagawae TaxID=91492 RepID=A0ABQ1A3K8_9EURO|nr:low-affinity potassium transport protein [Aspergillus udagawae]GFF72703.1 low-affinity potassium transport protein [Aspergillus udagawae]GFG00460.1 low-affinity potassium transport protein [Aspergillus udagawae]GFG19927.1 low-affinity potassium transport protein [Aspergillus udagawae]